MSLSLLCSDSRVAVLYAAVSVMSAGLIPSLRLGKT